jgi:hypothetical protein
MAVVEYKLERELLTGVLTIPSFIKNGGQMPSPVDDTLVGWTYSDKEVKYALPSTARVLTRQMFIDRQLSHAASEIDTTELITQSTNWYDSFVTENVANLTLDIADVKKQRIQEAFSVLENKLNNAVVTVEIASSGNQEPFGCDSTTQNNIIGINAAIAVGVSVPNPMYWTPKGSTTPVAVTHQELADIGSALLNKKNDLYQVYFVHKANINNCSTLDEVYKYDYSLNY